MSRVPWTVRTERRGRIEVDALDEWPSHQRGETFTTQLYIYAERGAAVGGLSPGADLGGTDGGTFGTTGGFTFPGVEDSDQRAIRYRRLRQFADFAGAFATGETAVNQPWFREQLPAEAPVDSLVVGLEPPADLGRDHPGVWALVQSVTDQTPPSESRYILEFELVTLAELTEYTDHAAVKAALSA